MWPASADLGCVVLDEAQIAEPVRWHHSHGFTGYQGVCALRDELRRTSSNESISYMKLLAPPAYI